MARNHLLLAVALLASTASALCSEPSANLLPRFHTGVDAADLMNVNVLLKTEGDLNGDGLADYAAIVTTPLTEGAAEQERLVVLAGAADGTYKLLSLSGEFCGVARNGKFYELSISESSLFVRGVWAAEPERYSGFTLQFRYRRSMNDLQLIREQSEWTEDGQTYRVSFDYLTRAVVHRREDGNKHKEVKAQLINAAAIKLHDYQCFSQDALKPNVHIDQNLSVRRQ